MKKRIAEKFAPSRYPGVRWGLSVAAILIVLFTAVVKFPGLNVNYQNSDASWHVLLTVQAYDETPAEIHHFLPIVTRGAESDKWIPWGATVQDSQGNFYYTSFSAALFVVPYLFFKIFHLPVNEMSLYILNTVLFACAALLWVQLIYSIFKENKDSWIIALIGLISYIVCPQMLHDTGIVYWAQSLMQVTLLIQFYAYYKYKQDQSTAGRVIFYIMALVNPYIEWTGVVANAGFAIAEIWSCWKTDRKTGWLRAVILGVITGGSLILFVCHYLLVIDIKTLMNVMLHRFNARSVQAGATVASLIGRYTDAFWFMWILFAILILWNFIARKQLTIKHGFWCFVLAFPVVENLLMREHAVSYPFDTLKLSFILSFLLCDLAEELLEYSSSKRVGGILLTLTVLCAGFNLQSYRHNLNYVTPAEYRISNRAIAEQLNSEYTAENSLFATEHMNVRGYLPMLFGRSIYEHVDDTQFCELTKSKGKQYAVILSASGDNSLPCLEGATVYDVIEDTVTPLYYYEGALVPAD